MKIILRILLLLFAGATCAYGQNISGNWQGVVFQVSGGTSPYYPFSMQLTQNGTNITGRSTSKSPDDPSYVIESLTGTINNNSFVYSATGIIFQIPPRFPYHWCDDDYGTLIFDPATQTIAGPLSSACGGPGSIEIWRLAVTSDTVFCADEPVTLSVTGQNIKWYRDSTLTLLADTGNNFSPAITTTTTFYVTQTHYNTESPPIMVTAIIKPKSFSIINMAICQGEKYLGYNLSGTYTDTLVAANGCDSVRTLHLTVKQKSFSIINQVICQGQQYLGYNLSGTYIDTLVAVNGCDSVRTLHLTVNHKSFSSVNIAICPGQTYAGYTTAGTYTDTLVAANGCDSVRTLHLIVKQKSYSTINQTICDGQDYFGYTAAGTYTDTFTAANGCDSIRTLNLTVDPASYCMTVVIPNTFSPNSDGVNDVWEINGLRQFTNCTVKIFNRLGQLVYNSTGYTTPWNGTYGGQKLPFGTYYYIINVPDTKKMYAGWVLIVR